MSTKVSGRQVRRMLFGVMLVVGMAWSALFLAWQSLSAVDFLFPVWYRALAIDAHIEQYAPQNLYRHGFEASSDAERFALFSDMLRAVNRSGEGLAELSYRGPSGEPVPLLREPERVHLESVALLLDRLRSVSYVLLGVLAIGAWGLWRYGYPPPRPRAVLVGSLVATLCAAAAVFAYGPRAAFALAHELVFPPDEQWFFYYQESLMTTLLKAPDLFAVLTVLLVVVALLWFVGLSLAARRLLSKRESKTG